VITEAKTIVANGILINNLSRLWIQKEIYCQRWKNGKSITSG